MEGLRLGTTCDPVREETFGLLIELLFQFFLFTGRLYFVDCVYAS